MYRELAKDVSPADRARITQTSLGETVHIILREIQRLTPRDRPLLVFTAEARRIRTSGFLGGAARAVGARSSLAPGILVGYFGVPIGHSLAIEFGNQYRAPQAPIRRALDGKTGEFIQAYGETFGAALLRRAAVHGRRTTTARNISGR